MFGYVKIASASLTMETCNIDGKILSVNQEYVKVRVAKISMNVEKPIPCTSIKEGDIYKIKLENFITNAYGRNLLPGQDLIVSGSGSAMGPNGPVSWDGWELTSVGNITAKLPINFEKIEYGDSLVEGSFYKISDLNKIIPSHESISRTFKTEGYVIFKMDYPSGCPKCPEGIMCDIYCPNMAIFSETKGQWREGDDLKPEMIRAVLVKEAEVNAETLILNSKYSLTVRVSSSWRDPEPKNYFKVTSISGEFFSPDQQTKISFWGRLWGWFKGLFKFK